MLGCTPPDKTCAPLSSSQLDRDTHIDTDTHRHLQIHTQTQTPRDRETRRRTDTRKDTKRRHEEKQKDTKAEKIRITKTRRQSRWEAESQRGCAAGKDLVLKLIK